MKAKGLFVIGFAVFGIYYLQTALAVKALDYKFVKLQILKIESDYIRFGFTLNLINSKAISLTFREINVQLFLNGTYVANLNNPIVQKVPGMTTSAFLFSVDISYSAFGDALWQALLNNQVDNYQLDLAGTIKVNNITCPVKSFFTAQEIKDALS